MDSSEEERDLTERVKALSERERVSTDERERRDKEREMDSKIYETLRTRNVISLQNLLEENELIFDRFLTDFVSQIPPLHIAIQHRSVNLAREILRRKPQLAYVLSSQGFSPLRMASANGSVDIVRELLPLIVDVSHDRDSKGWTPVHAAAMKGHLHVLEEFNGTNTEWIRDMTDRDETVLHLCVKYNKHDALKMLILLVGPDNEFVNQKDVNGNTILHLSAMKKDKWMITYLISTETGVEINATNMNGFTALDVFALCHGNSADKKMVNELIRKKGAANSLEMSTEKAAKEKAATEIRNVLILVGTLTATLSFQVALVPPIATLSFQVALVPPGGLWQDDSNMGFNNSSDKKNHTAGTSILADKDPHRFKMFQTINYFLFSISLVVILGGAMSTVRGGLYQKFVNPVYVTVMLFVFLSVMLYLCNKDNTPEGFTPGVQEANMTPSKIFPVTPLVIFLPFIILFCGVFYRLVWLAVARIRGSNVDTGTQQLS